jgi:GTP-binding protein HflX
LLNALTEAGVLAENMLFATLDPTARALELPDGRSVMLVDTVGLVSRLPHHLVEAFKSTLEEAVNADLILNVCDASSDEAEEQIKITRTLLDELGGGSIPMLTVANKCDALGEKSVVMGEKTVFISAKTGYGLDKLLKEITESLKSTVKRLKILVPYFDGGILNTIRQNGKVFLEEYREDGIFADVLVDIKDLDKVKEYMV